MSETQAIETVEEIEVVEGEPVEVITEEPEAIEIEIEGGAKPAPRGKSRFEKRIRAKNEQISEVESRFSALQEENKLLRLAQQQSTSTKLDEPDEDQLSEEEYKAAKKAYERQLIEEIAESKAQELLKKTQQQTTQVNQAQQQEASFSEHYKRADAMNIKNFDELEGNAVEILGKDFVQGLIAKTDNSHEIIASIGASPGKAAEIAEIAKTDVVKAFLKAVTFKINPNLSVSLKQTPDPDVSLSPGEPTGDQSDKKLEALRSKAAVSGDLKELIAYKKSLREKENLGK